MTGGNIIIPILIKIDETTISITKKGRNIRNPISKAVFSSLIVKAGITTDRGKSSIVLGFFIPLLFSNGGRYSKNSDS